MPKYSLFSRKHQEPVFECLSHYPRFPPPLPRTILLVRDKHKTLIGLRKSNVPWGAGQDTPLFALYRIYEQVALVSRSLHEMEAFFNKGSWAVQDIPDPKDVDPERYALLAGCAYLLRRYCNTRIKADRQRRDDLQRKEHGDTEEANRVPQKLRPLEEVPGWAVNVAPLEDPLVILMPEGRDMSNALADPELFKKRILMEKLEEVYVVCEHQGHGDEEEEANHEAGDDS